MASLLCSGAKGKTKPKLAPIQPELLGRVAHVQNFCSHSIPFIVKKSCPRVQLADLTMNNRKGVCPSRVWYSQLANGDSELLYKQPFIYTDKNGILFTTHTFHCTKIIGKNTNTRPKLYKSRKQTNRYLLYKTNTTKNKGSLANVLWMKVRPGASVLLPHPFAVPHWRKLPTDAKSLMFGVLFQHPFMQYDSTEPSARERQLTRNQNSGRKKSPGDPSERRSRRGGGPQWCGHM